MLPEAVQKTVSIFVKTQGQNLTKALPWPVGRYRRILPALITNQNAGFVTVPSENKIITFMPLALLLALS